MFTQFSTNALASSLGPSLHFRLGLKLLIAILVAVTLFLYFGHENSNPIFELLYIALMVLFALFARIVAPNAKKDNFPFLIIVVLAISFGAKNGGLFSIGAGAIFWPSMASFFLKPRPLISTSGSILTFAAILFFGLVSGHIPSLENPVFPSLLSLGLNAIVLSIINNYGFRNFGKISQKQEKEIVAARELAYNADNKSKERATFIAQMSHEIRNPLNAIIGFGDLLRSEPYGPLLPQYKEFAELILQGGHHLNDLVGDILDMSKIEAGRYVLKAGNFDLVDIAHETIALSQSNALSKSIQINYSGATHLEMNADMRAMRQILLNLLSNAIKYSDEFSKVKVRVFANSTNVWLEVEDTGRGMSNEEIARIGEPYLEAKSNDNKTRTTGLGLSLVKKLTEMQNGEFNVRSQIGKGSIFSLKFPINPNI